MEPSEPVQVCTGIAFYLYKGIIQYTQYSQNEKYMVIEVLDKGKFIIFFVSFHAAYSGRASCNWRCFS